jgi:hypothetical protein
MKSSHGPSVLIKHLKKGICDILLYDNEMLIVDEQLTMGAKGTAFVCCEIEGLGLMCGNKLFLDIPM